MVIKTDVLHNLLIWGIVAVSIFFFGTQFDHRTTGKVFITLPGGGGRETREPPPSSHATMCLGSLSGALYARPVWGWPPNTSMLRHGACRSLMLAGNALLGTVLQISHGAIVVAARQPRRGMQDSPRRCLVANQQCPRPQIPHHTLPTTPPISL